MDAPFIDPEHRHPVLHVNLDGDGAWPELAQVPQDLIFDCTEAHLSALEGGMKSGLPSLALRFDIPEGRHVHHVVYQTSIRQWLQIADFLKAKFGDPRE